MLFCAGHAAGAAKLAAAPVAVDKDTVLEVTLTLPDGRVKLLFGRAKREGWINSRDGHIPYVSGVAGLSVHNHSANAHAFVTAMEEKYRDGGITWSWIPARSGAAAVERM